MQHLSFPGRTIRSYTGRRNTILYNEATGRIVKRFMCRALHFQKKGTANSNRNRRNRRFWFRVILGNAGPYLWVA